VLTVSVLYFKISDRPVPDNKTINTSENSVHKYKRTVSRVNYNDLTKVCNPPHMIERGDEGHIGINIYSNNVYYTVPHFTIV